MPGVNIEVLLDEVAQCENVPQGSDLNTYIKDCFMIYPLDHCGIKIDDRSSQVAFYDPLTDVHEVFVNIFKEDGTLCDNLVLTPFQNLNYDFPESSCYLVEIDVRYTIQWDDGFGNITPHTFQNVYMYPVCCDTCGDYFNMILQEIKCRIKNTQCEINKRYKVGRTWNELQNRIFALNNYLYALCNFCLTTEELDRIYCKVLKMKKVC